MPPESAGFIPFGVVSKATRVLKPVSKDIQQILLEAKSWYDAGETLYFDRKTLQEAKVFQQGHKPLIP